MPSFPSFTLLYERGQENTEITHSLPYLLPVSFPLPFSSLFSWLPLFSFVRARDLSLTGKLSYTSHCQSASNAFQGPSPYIPIQSHPPNAFFPPPRCSVRTLTARGEGGRGGEISCCVTANPLTFHFLFFSFSIPPLFSGIAMEARARLQKGDRGGMRPSSPSSPSSPSHPGGN